MTKYTKRGRRAHTEISLGIPSGRVGKAILAALGGTIPRGGEFLEFDVEHDEWCPHLRGGVCRCAPTAHVRQWLRAQTGMAS